MWLTHSIPGSTFRQCMRQLQLYGLLSKGRLSFSVAISALLGYFFAAQLPMLGVALCLFAGGWLVSAAAGALNQWIERDCDKRMLRTQRRPLPSGQLRRPQVLIWAVTCAGSGLLLLYFGTNLWSALLSLGALVLYVWVYTPLKRKGPIAVLVGALPGAMPPLLGCLAAEQRLTLAGVLLFGIQFIWQFPHFWAIAWLADKDYQRAGFKLLPGGGQGPRAAAHTMLYALFLLPLGLLPTYFGLCGPQAGWVALATGLLLAGCAAQLLRTQTQKAARQLMIASLLYLPLVQVAYVVYKI